MAENTQKQNSEQKPQGKSIFKRFESILDLEKLFEEGIPYKYLPQVLFTTFLILVYIANSYMVEKSIREIQKIKLELEDLRADYTTMKADYMTSIKQSEVAKRVKKFGLKESKKPPYKIIVDKGEY